MSRRVTQWPKTEDRHSSEDSRAPSLVRLMQREIGDEACCAGGNKSLRGAAHGEEKGVTRYACGFLRPCGAEFRWHAACRTSGRPRLTPHAARISFSGSGCSPSPVLLNFLFPILCTPESLATEMISSSRGMLSTPLCSPPPVSDRDRRCRDYLSPLPVTQPDGVFLSK